MVTQLNDNTFAAEVKQKGGIAVVDFSAAWCGPCRALAPHFDALAEENNDKANFFKVDIEEAEQTAAELGIMSVPTIIFFKDGQEVKKSVGLKNKAALQIILDELA